jgi:hypothetical protein
MTYFCRAHYPLDRRFDFQRVFNAIRSLGAVHSKANLDTYNIETVFTTLELAQVLRRFPGVEPAQIAPAVESLEALIATTLEWSINFPVCNNQILGPKTHKPLSKVWKSAANHLSEAMYIFVIGYSLPSTDALFRQLDALGSAGGARLRYLGLYNADPDGRVGRRFAKMIGTRVSSRYFPQKRNFADAIPHIGSILAKLALSMT